MPPKKLRPRRNRAALPEWSQKIANFRDSLKLSQSELGKRLGVSTMAVSRWERGMQEAPANIYIQLGKLAGDPLCWYFWGCESAVGCHALRANTVTANCGVRSSLLWRVHRAEPEPSTTAPPETGGRACQYQSLPALVVGNGG